MRLRQGLKLHLGAGTRDRAVLMVGDSSCQGLGWGVKARSAQSNHSARERGLSPECLKWKDAQSQTIGVRTPERDVKQLLRNIHKRRQCLGPLRPHWGAW